MTKPEELICRAKIRHGENWIEGFFFMPSEQDYSASIMRLGDYKGIWVKPETVCRSTTLYDLTGRLIFEYDIVQVGSFYGVVRFADGCFEVLMNSGDRNYLRCLIADHAVKVVGNFFDNPGYLTAIIKREVMEAR